ncbi:MAG: glutamate synthase subunit alpha, partial [Oligoflexia bacterium]|nr:glutamate synthase subunit alpha [Oligoflexia bacterium]
GQLPGHKVFPWIAKVRHSTPGVELISPPPHHDIYSIEDLAQLIHDLKNANPLAGISVKLVSSAGVGTIAAGVAKASANLVLISGYDGGTGAAPLSSIKCAGIPWELGLADAHQTLVLNNLRKRIIVEVDGQLKTGRDIVIGALLGAEEFGFGTLPLVSLGCTMMRVCHLNTCPMGVATQNPELRKNFKGKPEYVVNLMRFIAQEAREIMASLGIDKFDDLVGNTELIVQRNDIKHWKAKGVSLSRILYKLDSAGLGRRYIKARNYQFKPSMDQTKLIELCRPALEKGEKVEANLEIENTDRVVGTMLGGEISKKYGLKGLPEDTIKLNFRGSAGQSFGAFIPHGMSLFLQGDANDYVGKGLSGGKIAVFPHPESAIVPHENVIIGNVAFFGGTSGEAYINGLAGERFCVRNSGVQVVVEGVGDHGCEYMTGGRVIVLGAGIGKNFAAGMSGGIAYVFDEQEILPARCNKEMVDLEPVNNEDTAYIRGMLERHVLYTGSYRAKQILNNWQAKAPRFLKVMPKEYKRVLQELKKTKETDHGQANGVFGI